MTLSTIEVLEKAGDLGLKLAVAPPDRLTYQPLEKCPADFVETLKGYKGRLLSLLRLPFVMVFSETLEETIFFCADEPTRAALIEAGADPFAARYIIEHDGWREDQLPVKGTLQNPERNRTANLEAATEHIDQIEKLLDLPSRSTELRTRLGGIKPFFERR